jgi:L-amino acid N-acyltransferase YncA
MECLAMTSISIRPARLDDIETITAIYAHAVTHGTASFELEPPTQAEMVERMKGLLDGNFPYIVAESDGAVVGYAYAALYRTRPAYRFSVEDSVYVDPRAQRLGIGRILLGRLIVESEKRGFRQMIAVIGDSNQTPSIELHRACGFEMIGPIKNVGYKFGRWLDTVLMQRALGDGARTKPSD